MKKQEDHYRELFAQDRHNSVLSDLYLNMVDVFRHRDSFKFQNDTDPKERSIPKILAQKRPNLAALDGQYSVVDQQQYARYPPPRSFLSSVLTLVSIDDGLT